MAFSDSTFVLASGNPVIAGSTISPTWANATLQDIAANGLSQVILRSGIAPFSGEALIIDGSPSTPGIGFNSESSTGLYKPAAGTIGFSCAAAEVATVSASGINILSGTLNNSLTDDITAAGTNQGTATDLFSGVNNVTTVPSSTGVELPLATSTPGMLCTVINSGANALLIYPAGTNTIDTNGASVAITIGAGFSWTGYADSSGNWHTIGTNNNLAGTAHQVIVTQSEGATTLSLPQSIATTSAVQFGSVEVGIATIGGAPTSYGSITVSGTTGGYAGIQFTGISGYNTFMMSGTNTGVYNPSGGWQWYISAGAMNGLTEWAAALTVTGAFVGESTVTATGFNVSSDINLKTNVRTIANPVDTVKQLRGAAFSWVDDMRSDLGVIAQEVEQVLPQLVHKNPNNDTKTVNYNGLIGLLLESVKELSGRLDALEA